MATTGLEVRFREGRERAEVRRFTSTLDEIVRSLREIDRVYLQRGSRATWVIADLSHEQSEMIVRLQARPSTRSRTTGDMLVPVEALVSGAGELQEVPEVPKLFQPATVERLAALAQPRDGVQGVSIAAYNGTVGRAIALSDSVHVNATQAVKAFDISYGTVSGVLDSVGARKRTPDIRVSIYQDSTRNVVAGVIPERLAEEVRSLWLHRVIVQGKVKRNQRGQTIRVEVDRIHALPERGEPRPPVADIAGIAPDWIGGRDVDEFIREIRDA